MEFHGKTIQITAKLASMHYTFIFSPYLESWKLVEKS